MGDREQLGDLVFAVVKDRFKIAKRLRPDPADKPGDRRFHFNANITDINREVPAELFNKMGEEFPGMTDVGCGPDAGGDQDGPGLLGGHRDPAGAPLVVGEIALAVGAEAAEIAEREVEWFVPCEKRVIPRP
jgi:hypothetical protein